MLQRHAPSRRPTTAFHSSSQTSTRSSSRPARCGQRSSRASRAGRLHCESIHREYARQGSAAAQQEAPAGVSNNAAAGAQQQQQLLSVPEDIVLECLTIMRYGYSCLVFDMSGRHPSQAHYKQLPAWCDMHCCTGMLAQLAVANICCVCKYPYLYLCFCKSPHRQQCNCIQTYTHQLHRGANLHCSPSVPLKQQTPNTHTQLTMHYAGVGSCQALLPISHQTA